MSSFNINLEVSEAKALVPAALTADADGTIKEAKEKEGNDQTMSHEVAKMLYWDFREMTNVFEKNYGTSKNINEWNSNKYPFNERCFDCYHKMEGNYKGEKNEKGRGKKDIKQGYRKSRFFNEYTRSIY